MTDIQSTLTFSTSSDKLFFGESGHGIARYDTVRYPQFLKIDERMKSLYWRPQEIDVGQERASFNKMNEPEQFVFTENLSRQIMLDSIQGRAPSLAFLPHCTDPSLENCITTWSFFETIHSESYTHIIRAIYPDPSAVFDRIPQITSIVDCAVSITQAYDELMANPNKENLYMGLVAANALEALRFYVSFACTFSFAERGLVEGSAKLVKLIARDEAQHLALVQHILKVLERDDPDYVQIIQDNRRRAKDVFNAAAHQEKAWASHLFSKGSILGLNEKILNQYVDYLLVKRKHAVGLTTTAKSKVEHPIPWIEKWYSGSGVQVAPQEVEVSSYLTGSVVNDMTEAEFSF
jgi:ribonucleoside-diphosphate reductase beta chain